jgi:uncharacterized protein (DUF433 family)
MEPIRVEDYISVDPDICHGKPCFKGTRIMVSVILELLEAGESIIEIIDNYPGLTPQHIQAALHLASQMLANERYVLFPAAWVILLEIHPPVLEKLTKALEQLLANPPAESFNHQLIVLQEEGFSVIS